MNKSSVVVIVRSEGDGVSSDALATLAQFASMGIAKGFYEVTAEEAAPSGSRYLGRFLSHEGFQDCEVLEALADLGAFKELLIVGVSGSVSSAAQEVTIDRGIRSFRNSLAQLLGIGLRVADIRVGVRAFGEELPGAEFFAIDADLNAIVVPVDRKEDGGIAKPIRRDETPESRHLLALHTGTELASLLGLWTAMDEVPASRFTPLVAGSSIPKVRFVQSRVRVLVSPSLPISMVSPSDKDLPTPPEFLPVSNPNQSCEALAEELYPNSLIFTPDLAPSDFENRWGSARGLVNVAGEMFRALPAIPRIVVRGLQSELDRASSEILQGIVGQDSGIRVQGSTFSEGEQPDLVNIQSDALVAKVATESAREMLSPVGRNEWAELVRGYFGALDGSSDYRDLRRSVLSNENLVLVNRSSIGRASDDLREVIDQFSITDFNLGDALEEIRAHKGPELAEAHREAGSPVDVGPGAESLGEGLRHEAAADEARNSALGQHINDRFNRERSKAFSSALRALESLRLGLDQLSTKTTVGVSSLVAVAAWVSSLLIVFVLATCTPLRDLLDVMPSSDVRDALFIALTAIFVAGAILLLGLDSDEDWQKRVIVVGGAIGILVALLLIFYADVKGQLRLTSAVPWAGLAIGLAALWLMGIAVRRNLASPSPARRELARLYLVAVTLYVLVCLVFGGVRDRSPLGQADNRTRLLVAGLIMSCSILIAAVAVIAAVQYREKNRLNSAAARVNFFRREFEDSADALRKLSAAQAQWVGTAVALQRFAEFPLGKPRRVESYEFSQLAGDETVLKFDVAQLELNERGLDGLVARLRRHVVTAGWLQRQYEKAVRSFQQQLSFRTGIEQELLTERRPEADPSVQDIGDISNGVFDCDRWRFSADLYAGAFDSNLSLMPDEFSLDSIYQTVLDDSAAYRLRGSQSGNVSAREFVAQVLPRDVVDLPTGLIDRAFTASDSARRLESTVWWPGDVLGECDSEICEARLSRRSTSPAFLDHLVLLGVRVDISEPFVYTECTAARRDSDNSPQTIASSVVDDF